jgi:hypothetical protein
MNERQKKLERKNGENLNPLKAPPSFRLEYDRYASLVEYEEVAVRSNDEEFGIELQDEQN